MAIMFYGASSFNQNLCSWSFPSSYNDHMFEVTSCPYSSSFYDPPAFACYACY